MKPWQWRVVAHVLYRIVAHINQNKPQDWLEKALYWHCIHLSHGDPGVEFDWKKIDRERKEPI